VLRTHKKPSKRCAPAHRGNSPPRPGSAEPQQFRVQLRFQEMARARAEAESALGRCGVSWFLESQRSYVWRLFQWFANAPSPKLVWDSALGCGGRSRAVRSDCFVMEKVRQAASRMDAAKARSTATEWRERKSMCGYQSSAGSFPRGSGWNL